MLCKIVDSEDETQPIGWRKLSAEQSNATGSPQSPKAIAAAVPVGVALTQPSKGFLTKTATKGGMNPNQITLLQIRIAELEAQIPVEAQSARQAGMEQGLRQAREQAAAEMQGALDRLAKTIQDVAQAKRKIRDEAETELVKLALAIAKRILHREVSADPQSLLGIVHAALQRLQNREVSRIRVHPAAVQTVRSALERNGGLKAMEIVPDASLQPGGVLFETALGELDASVDTQLQEIERGFADRLRT